MRYLIPLFTCFALTMPAHADGSAAASSDSPAPVQTQVQPQQAPVPSLPASSAAPAPVSVPTSAPAQVPASPQSSSSPIESFADRIDIADGFFARDMFELALEEYRRIQKDYPAAPEISHAYFQAAESLFLLERWAEALEVFGDFAKRFPDSAEAPKAAVRTGEALYQAGRKDEARAQFLTLAESNEAASRNTARYYLGKIFFENAQYDEAAAILDPIAADAAAMYAPFSNYYLGQIALERGDAAAASSYHEKAAASPETSTLGRFGLGRAYFLMGNYAGAKSAFQGVWSAPGDTGLGEDAFLNFLSSLYNLADYAGVVSWDPNLDVQLRDASKRMQAKFLIADSLAHLKRTGDALAVYEAIIASAPESEKRRARIERVEAIAQSGDIPAALKEIERLIDSGEGDEGPLTLLMVTLLKQVDQPLEAVVRLDRLISHGKADDKTLAEAMLTKSYTLIESDRPKRARSSLDQFLQKFPAAAQAEKALYDVVLLDVQLGDKERAAADARAYLEKYPDGEYAERAGLRLASLYTDLGAQANARRIFDEYFRRYADSPRAEEAYFLAGYNEQTGGDPGKALEYYRRVSESGVPKETYVSMLKNRGSAAVALDDAPSAAADYEELTSRFPTASIEPEVFFWLIDYKLAREDAAGARAALDRFAARPEAKSRLRELEFFTGETLRIEKNYADAVAHYDLLIADAGPLRADAYLGRGLVAAAQGDREKARADFAQAIHEAGENHETAVRARRETAKLLYEEGKYADAAKGYMAIAILYDDARYAPESLMLAAKSFEKSGDAANAQKTYRELTERFPRHPLSAEAAPKIRKEAL